LRSEAPAEATRGTPTAPMRQKPVAPLPEPPGFFYSPTQSDILLRCCFFTAVWCTVRVLLSATLFRRDPESQRRAVQLTGAINSALIFPSAVWVVLRDPAVAPSMRTLISFAPGPLDLVNLHSPTVSLLATMAAGEFAMQMIHVRAWFLKKDDALMAAHHVLSLVFWPISQMAQRGGFFIAFYMLYEASTPFLQTLTLPWVKARPTLHALDGTLFTICFLLFRIVTIPHFVYGLYVALPYFRSAPTFTDCPQWYSESAYSISASSG